MKIKLSLIFVAFLSIYLAQYIKKYHDIESTKQQRTSSGKIVKQSDKELNCLISLLWYESRSESHKGIKYVLSVVENRKNSPKYPKSYCEIMLQPKQFSFVDERVQKGLSLEVFPEAVEKKKLDFIREIAYDAVQGRFKSVLPSNVLHYAKNKVRNHWTRKKKVYTVEGKHKFYLSSIH